MSEQQEKKDESGSSSLIGYRVEARMELPGIIETVGDQSFASEWKPVTVVMNRPGMPGVPADMWGDYLKLAGCMSYHQAMAIAWWFYAECEAQHKYGMRVRVTSHNVSVSWRCSDTFASEQLPDKMEMAQRRRMAAGEERELKGMSGMLPPDA